MKYVLVDNNDNINTSVDLSSEIGKSGARIYFLETKKLDIKEFNKSDQIFKELHSLVIEFDGRVYLTKDSKLKKEEFISMYKNNAQAFTKVRNKYSLNNFSSYMSTRIGLSKWKNINHY